MEAATPWYIRYDTFHRSDRFKAVLSLLYVGEIGLLVTIVTDHLVRFCLLLAEYNPVRTGKCIYIFLFVYRCYDALECILRIRTVRYNKYIDRARRL